MEYGKGSLGVKMHHWCIVELDQYFCRHVTLGLATALRCCFEGHLAKRIDGGSVASGECGE